MIKHTVFKSVSIAVAGAALCVAGTAWSQNRELGAGGQLLDGVAALADDGVVLRSEIAQRLQTVADNFTQTQLQLPPEQRSPLPPLSVLEQQVLDRLILEELQVQRAERIGIVIGDDILNQVLAEIARNIGIELAELPEWMEAQGINYQAFREEQRRATMIQELERREVYQRVAITPRELQQCVDRTVASQSDEFEYNISHILIGFSPNASPDEIDAAESLARDIVRQLDEGADFAELAFTHSDSQTALDGGALGWRQGSELPTIFAQDVRELEVGEHSTPIRSSSGFHLVRLNDLRGAEPQLVEQVRARHILLTTNEILDDDATMQKLQGIRNQIINGDEFATVAAVTSEDTGSAIDGGDLGWAEPSAYTPEFAAKLESLEIGELSEPFQTPVGWHIAEVTGRRTYDMSADMTEMQCRQRIGESKVIDERELWQRRIMDEAFIVKRL